MLSSIYLRSADVPFATRVKNTGWFNKVPLSNYHQ